MAGVFSSIVAVAPDVIVGRSLTSPTVMSSIIATIPGSDSVTFGSTSGRRWIARVPALADYEALVERAARDPEGFWGDIARAEVDWSTPWEQVLDWTTPPVAKWFVGGRLNVAENWRWWGC